jgi:hypothetical protein
MWRKLKRYRVNKMADRQYRDGLMLVLLSLWIIRRRSFAALTVSRHIEFDQAGMNILLYPEDTKSKREESFRVPEAIVPYLTHYLSAIRRALPQGSRPKDPARSPGSRAAGALWGRCLLRLRSGGGGDWQPSRQCDRGQGSPIYLSRLCRGIEPSCDREKAEPKKVSLGLPAGPGEIRRSAAILVAEQAF